MIRKAVIVELEVDGTEEQANCVADAVGYHLAGVISKILTPVQVSEDIEHVKYTIDRLRRKEVAHQ